MKTCKEENATLDLPEEPEHKLHVPVWINHVNLVKKVDTTWKADGGISKGKYKCFPITRYYINRLHHCFTP